MIHQLRFLFTFLLLFAAAQSNAARETFKPQRLVIWIHGLGSSERDTGVMKETLEKHLPRIDSTREYQFQFFNYNTVDNQLKVPDFVEEFDRFVTKIEKSMDESTKVTLLAHSQGGLVAYYWLNQHCTTGLKSKPHPICRHIDSLTTVGTPLWGSRIANLGFHVKNSMGDVLHLKEFGKAQLKDLSLLSDQSFSNLDLFVDPAHRAFRDLFRKQIRLKVVIGYGALNHRLWGKLFPGNQSVEDDSSVAVSCANPDLILNSGKFLSEPHLPMKVVYVKSMHMPTLRSNAQNYLKSKELGGIVRSIDYSSLTDVEETCLDNDLKKCTTPAVPILINSILNRPDPEQEIQLSSFSIHGKITLPKSQSSDEFLDYVASNTNFIVNQMPDSAFEFSKTLSARIVGQDDLISISPSSEIYSKIFLSQGGSARFYFAGQFITDKKEASVQIEILEGANVIKTLTTRIQAGKSSFVIDDFSKPVVGSQE